MFGPAGYTYIYFTYGMHWCFNIVTGPEHYPAAVLIRALEPLEGFAAMCRLRNTSDPTLLTSGPSRLCQAFDISKKLNAKPLNIKLGAWVEKVSDTFMKRVVAKPRIGVDYAGEYRHKLWRYYLKDNPYVSKK